MSNPAIFVPKRMAPTVMPTSATVLEGQTSANFQITALGALIQNLVGTISATSDGVVKTAGLIVTLLP